MRIITISREFGSGGRELVKRLSDILGFDYYDREIVTQIAETKNLNEKYVEKALENYEWSTIPLTFRHSFTRIPTTQSISTELLIEQKKVIESIAQKGKDFVIVGRNADMILESYKPLNLFICADMPSKLKRCKERAQEGEKITEKDLKRNIKSIDRARAKTRDLISGSKWGDREAYQLIINTTGWEIKELSPIIADFATRWFETK